MVNTNAALTEAVYYILLSLKEPMHGYGIIQNVKELTNGRLVLARGTLYGALTNLLARGWIDALPGAEDSRKKEYIIADLGKEALNCEFERLCELVKNGEIILNKGN